MPVADWMLERLVLDDLTAEERERVMHALSLEDGGMERLEAMRASDVAILKRYPPRVIGMGLRSQLETETRRRRWQVGLVLLPVLAAVVGVMVMGALDVGPTQPTDPYIGIKGEPRLSATRRLAGGNEVLTPGHEVTSGDVVQLSYVAMGAKHGVIVSVDGAGVATLHSPLPGRGTALEQDGTTHLSTAYRLDDAPVFERFFLLTSDVPIDVEEVMEAARAFANTDQADTLAFPMDLQVSSLMLRKTP